MKWILIVLIHLYQLTLSPDHGPLKRFFPHGYCRFHPTCSDYGMQALRKRGFFRGTALMSWRILRCNPLSPGGEDLVPEAKPRA